jgi:hypothetical protein
MLATITIPDTLLMIIDLLDYLTWSWKTMLGLHLDPMDEVDT